MLQGLKLLIISLIINAYYYICMLQVERIERKFLGEISDEKNGFCIRMLPEGKPKKTQRKL